MDEDGLVLEHPRNVEEGPVCARIVPSHQGTLVRPRLIEHRQRALRLIVRGDASRLERLYPAKDPKGPRGPPVAASGGEVRTAAIEVLQFRRGAVGDDDAAIVETHHAADLENAIGSAAPGPTDLGDRRAADGPPGRAGPRRGTVGHRGAGLRRTAQHCDASLI